MTRLLKKKERIYILPTKMGGYLNGLIFLMFLLSIGYNNNLLLIFTLFLLGFNLTWVIQTHYHLQRLSLGPVFISEGHAGEALPITVFWNRVPEGPWAWEMSLENESSWRLGSSHHDASKTLSEVIIPKRGLHRWDHLKVKTTMPFGLYRAWIYLPVDLELPVYPARLRNPGPLAMLKVLEGGEENSGRKGAEGVLDLAPYDGGEARKMSWKHYARSGELLMKEGEGTESFIASFRLIPFDPAVKERLLSELATQMVSCHLQERPFSLVTLSGRVLEGRGQKHLQECLKELALC